MSRIGGKIGNFQSQGKSKKAKVGVLYVVVVVGLSWLSEIKQPKKKIILLLHRVALRRHRDTQSFFLATNILSRSDRLIPKVLNLILCELQLLLQ